MKTSSLISDEVICAFSGGKDSIVTIDLCHKHFKKIHAFFMYHVPDLSFQNNIIKFYEKKYNIEILKLPHMDMSTNFKNGILCVSDNSVMSLKINDIYAYVRDQFNCEWIAAGERAKDSLFRNSMIKNSSSIDRKRKRFYPVAWWNKQEILDYIKINKLPISEEYKYLGHSFKGLYREDLKKIKEFYPEDFEKIKKFYKFAEASIC